MEWPYQNSITPQSWEHQYELQLPYAAYFVTTIPGNSFLSTINRFTIPIFSFCISKVTLLHSASSTRQVLIHLPFIHFVMYSTHSAGHVSANYHIVIFERYGAPFVSKYFFLLFIYLYKPISDLYINDLLTNQLSVYIHPHYL